MTSFVSLVWLVACTSFFPLAVLAGTTVPVSKRCLLPQYELRRTRNRFCQTPNVPQRICQGESCRDELEVGASVCRVVAHALLTQYEIFDVVLLHDASCRAEIPVGPLTLERVDSEILPNNHELVVLTILGSDLLEAIEHGIDQSLYLEVHEAYPSVAGMKYDVDSNKAYGERVVDAEILDYSCTWQAVQKNKIYQVLTTEDLANGSMGYSSLLKSISRTETQERLTDTFWMYAQSTCVLQDPYSRSSKTRGLFFCSSKRL